MRITINSCAEETLSHGTSAAIPLVLGFAMGCVIPCGVLFLRGILVENITANARMLIARCCPLWGGLIFVMFIASITLLVWLYYRYRVHNGRNIVALEKARYEVVKEVLRFTTSKIAVADGKIVIVGKIVTIQDDPKVGKDATTNQTMQKTEMASCDAYEIAFTDSALSSTYNRKE